MITLSEGQWDLDGFLFGKGTMYEVAADGLDFGTSTMATQDVARPQADGSLIGRDYLTGPEMQFTFLIRHGLNVWPFINQFQQAWRADAVRSQPGKLSTLRYRQHGVTYQSLGRARKFDVSPSTMRSDQMQYATATFQLADPERYIEPDDAAARSLTLQLIQPPSDGGWVFPATWPVELRPNSQDREGEVTIGGYRPAPFKVAIHGPMAGGTLSNIVLSGNGWSIGTTTTVSYNQTLAIDTAANTITKSGSSVAGTLARGSRLTSRLQPGDQFIKFSGSDPTGSAYAVVTWMDTIPA